MKTFSFAGFDCRINTTRYAHGGVCLQAVAIDTPNNKKKDAYVGELISTVTINMGREVKLLEGEVVIKDYAENIGILDTLVKNNLVTPTGKTCKAGFAVGHIVRIVP
jgi:hypothetical protein